MATVVIAKNNTVSDIFLDDLGVGIPASNQRALTDSFTMDEIFTSADLKVPVASGDVTINDGSIDLSVAEGLQHIRYETEFEDEQTLDPHEIDEHSDVPTKPTTGFKLLQVNSGTCEWIDTPSGGGAVALSALQVRRTTSLTVPLAWVDIDFDTTDVEVNDAILEHDNTNRDRFIAKEAGWYEVEMNTEIRTTTETKEVYYRARVNDSSVVTGSEFTVDLYMDETHEISRSFFVYLTPNDYVTIQIYAETGPAGDATLFPEASILLKPLKGMQGDKGDPGSGSTIVVQQDDSTVVAAADTLNFEGFRVTDEGGGKATIDLTDDGGDVYYIDSTRGDKALGVAYLTIGCGRNSSNTTGQYLRTYNGTPMNMTGIPLPYASTLIGITMSEQVNTQTWTAEVRRNGVATVLDSLVLTNAYYEQDMTKNTDFDAGDRIQVYLNGTNINYPQVRLYFRRRKV